MTRLKNWFYYLFFIILLLNSCKAVFITTPKENDIVISTELKELLDTKPNPVVVLRVPYSANKVTEADQKLFTQQTQAYNQIEMNLMKAGFTVRDRGLLNNLLLSGQTNYVEIQNKIQTDIIIEILSLDFSIDNNISIVGSKNTNKVIKLYKCSVNPKLAKLECKLVIVDKGQTGGMLKLYYTPCLKGCNLEVRPGHSWVRHLGAKAWQKEILWTVDQDEETMNNVIDYFCEDIIEVLRGNIQK